MNVTTRIWIDGCEISSNWDKVSFQKAMNSEALPAVIEAWGNPEMLVNFDRFVDGANACTTIDPWTKETGDDYDGTTVIHEIDVTSGVHSLHLYDASATAANTFDVSYPLPATITTGKIIRLHWTLTEAKSPATYFVVKFREGTTIGPHLKFELWLTAAGTPQWSYVYYTTDNGATWVYATSAYLGTESYFDVRLDVAADTFDVRPVTLAGVASAWVEDLAMDNAITTGIDTIELASPATEHGYEGFESYTIAASTPKNTAYWNNWDANGKGDLSVIAGQKAQFVKTAGAWTLEPIFSWPTAQPSAGAGWFSFILNVSAYPNSLTSLQAGTTGASPANLRVGIYWTTDGSLYFANAAGWTDSTINMALNTDYTIVFTFSNTTTYSVTVNGVAKGPYTTYESQTAALTTFRTSFIADTSTFTVDDLVTSWATAGPDVDPVEAYIYELWSDQTIDLDDVLDTPVNIMVNDKHAWRGWVQSSRMIDCSPADTEYKLQCLDVMRSMQQQHCVQSFLKASYTVDTSTAITDNRVLVHETPDLNLIGSGAVISLNPADNPYTADADSLKTSGAPDYVRCHSESGSHTDTQTKNDTFHDVHRDGTTGIGDATVTYTLQRAIDTEVPIKLELKVSGFLDASTAYAANISVCVLDSTGVESEYKPVMSKPTAPNPIWNTVTLPIDATITVADAATYCYANGANWEVKVRFRLTCMVSFGFRIDKLRAEMTARDQPYAPIDAAVYNVDVASKYVYIDHCPFADTPIKDLDSLRIGTFMQQVMVQSAVGFNRSAIWPVRNVFIQDMKGPLWIDVFKHCASTAGGYWYWQLDADGGESTLYWYPGILKRTYYDTFYDSAIAIDLIAGWDKGIGTGATANIASSANEGWHLYLHGQNSGGESNGDMWCRRTYGETGGMTRAEFAIREGVINDNAAYLLTVYFKTAGDVTRYKIQFDAAHKMTVTGSGAGSGQINHAIQALADFSLVRVVFTATSASLYILDVGASTWSELDLARAITSNDITKIVFDIVGGDAAGETIDYVIGYLNAVLNIDPTSTALAIQPRAELLRDAKRTGFVLVRGKSDLENPPAIINDDAPRDQVIVDDGLITQGMVNSKADWLAEKYADNSRSIRVQPKTGDDVYNVGDFYEIPFNGATLTDLVCRRAEFEQEAGEDKVPKWTLELDTGETAGKELIARQMAELRYNQRMSSLNHAAND